jgi:hypothetical protein
VGSGVESGEGAKNLSGVDLRVDSSRHLKKKLKIKSVSSVTMQNFSFIFQKNINCMQLTTSTKTGMEQLFWIERSTLATADHVSPFVVGI